LAIWNLIFQVPDVTAINSIFIERTTLSPLFITLLVNAVVVELKTLLNAPIVPEASAHQPTTQLEPASQVQVVISSAFISQVVSLAAQDHCISMYQVSQLTTGRENQVTSVSVELLVTTKSLHNLIAKSQ
jgi:hypothetical protein